MIHIAEFVEFTQWGWNATSIAFIGTLIFGFIFGWGLYKQIQTIRVSGTGRSIPMVMNVYFAFHFFAFSVYGWRIHSMAIILNGILGFLFLRIYIEASKQPDSNGRTRLGYIFFLLPFLMMVVSHPATLMSLLFISSSVMILDSPIKIIRNKDAGSVEPMMALCFIASALFWLVFSACIGEWPLCFANAFGILVMGSTLILWKMYKK